MYNGIDHVPAEKDGSAFNTLHRHLNFLDGPILLLIDQFLYQFSIYDKNG